jgi:putative addiction module component (TIGR02574 family)
MDTQFEKLTKEALELSPGERAAFAQLLLASLDEDAEIATAWTAEAERRAAELDNGTVTVVPLAEALAQVRTLLK